MAPKKKHIIALGGGGLAPTRGGYRLERYIFQQSGKKNPKVAFLPTASGEDKDYIINFYKAGAALNAQPSHLSFFVPHTADMADYLLSQDVIFVGGGNTRTMLAIWREWGIDKILRQAWNKGIVLCGSSAGMICWFEQGATDSIPGKITPLPGLGFLPHSACPHYDSEPLRLKKVPDLIAKGALAPCYALDDFVGAHFIGRKLHQCVSGVQGQRAHFIHQKGARPLPVVELDEK